MNHNYTGYTALQVRSNCIIKYFHHVREAKYIGDYGDGRWHKLKEIQKKTYSGTMTKGAKKRLTRSIDLLCQLATSRSIFNPITQTTHKHRLSFITLTIASSNNLTAKQAYDSLLTPFLQWLRRTAKVSTYVWKVEFQTRGQAHYHITTPSFIPHQDIRDKWNNIQRAAGLLDEFEKKYGHSNPPSTEIKAVKNIENLTSYMIKEFCKAVQNQPTVGKIWDCSLNLKKFKMYSVQEGMLEEKVIREMANDGLLWITEMEHCHIITLPQQGLIQLLSLDKIQKYDQFLMLVRNYKRETKDT